MATRKAGSALHGRNVSRPAANTSINQDLSPRTKRLPKNLPGTAEEQAGRPMQAELARKKADDEAVEQIIGVLNAFHEKHGLLSDEFSNL